MSDLVHHLHKPLLPFTFEEVVVPACSGCCVCLSFEVDWNWGGHGDLISMPLIEAEPGAHRTGDVQNGHGTPVYRVEGNYRPVNQPIVTATTNQS